MSLSPLWAQVTTAKETQKLTFSSLTGRNQGRKEIKHSFVFCFFLFAILVLSRRGICGFFKLQHPSTNKKPEASEMSGCLEVKLKCPQSSWLQSGLFPSTGLKRKIHVIWVNQIIWVEVQEVTLGRSSFTFSSSPCHAAETRVYKQRTTLMLRLQYRVAFQSLRCLFARSAVELGDLFPVWPAGPNVNPIPESALIDSCITERRW